uniref:Uncharacterized protein n=1 Tax=Rhizophora mucronata TaxID=61149 RepID=A0A2P2PQJ0_RHIMU
MPMVLMMSPMADPPSMIRHKN